MNKGALLAKVGVGILLLWGAVYGIKALVQPHQATADRVDELVSGAKLEDYSKFEEVPNRSTKEDRRETLEDVASVVNRLDLASQQKAQASLEDLWAKLSSREREVFVGLTAESFNNFFRAFDALTPDARRQFIDRGMREIENGTTENRMMTMLADDPELVSQIAGNGMRAYFQNASAETKLEIAPFIKATNEVMQGIRGQPFQGGGFGQ